MEKITMKMIAEKVGMSADTVSKALNMKSGVKEETRELIVMTANAMGYSHSIPEPDVEKEIEAEQALELKSGMLVSIEGHGNATYFVLGDLNYRGERVVAIRARKKTIAGKVSYVPARVKALQKPLVERVAPVNETINKIVANELMRETLLNTYLG